MEFNYAREKLKFEKTWQITRQQYEKAGMSPEAIASMREFDWEWFKSQRRYLNHMSDLSESSALDRISQDTAEYSIEIYVACGVQGRSRVNRYQWLDEIDDEKLLKKLMQLSSSDIELLTRIVFEEQLQSEIAQELAVSQAAISKHLHKIKKILR